MEEEEEQQQQKQKQKRPLSIDFDKLIDDDAPPAVLVVKPSSDMASSDQASYGLEKLKDYELEENIRRKKSILENITLPDGGAKLRATIQRYEEELARRKANRLPEVLLLHVPTQEFFLFNLILFYFVLDSGIDFIRFVCFLCVICVACFSCCFFN